MISDSVLVKYGSGGAREQSLGTGGCRGEEEIQGMEGELYTSFIFFVNVTQRSPIPVYRRAIATFLLGESVFIMFAVLFHVR